MVIQNTRKFAEQRRIALYPGAFRPPHAAHFRAVQYLINRPDIDEVIIIISSRSRQIPGTDQALDPGIADKVWKIYLQGLRKVRVEIAATTAIHHALQYFTKARPNDFLSFCIGESDLQSGDVRFDKIQQCSKNTGIQARIISAPTGALAIRSTRMRAILAQGDQGMGDFWQALPKTLNLQDRHRVWNICQQGKRSICEIAEQKIRALLRGTALQPVRLLPGSNCFDPLFFLTTTRNQHLVVKYAGNSVEINSISQSGGGKSRERLNTERMALKWLNTGIRSETLFPQVVRWDKKEKMLVISHPCSDGQWLEDRLKAGKLDAWAIRQLGVYLASCHDAPAPGEAFWGAANEDALHWFSALQQHLSPLKKHVAYERYFGEIDQLQVNSVQSTEKQFVQLDFQPKNILINPSSRQTAVVDFERSGSIGDPAFELGFFMGHYLFNAASAGQEVAALNLLQIFLQSYAVSRDIPANDPLLSRASAFSGSTLLSLLPSASLATTQKIKLEEMARDRLHHPVSF